MGSRFLIIKESVPITIDKIKYPKVATMLFISHSAATAINAGKVYFTKDPLAINYMQKQVRRLYFVVACFTWLMGVAS